jgi:anti-sigma-K factor RskA
MPGDMTRDQFLQLAKDMGVSPEQLDSAETEYRRTEETREFWDAYRAYRMRNAFLALPILAVVAVFACLDGREDGTSVAFLVALFAGIGAAVVIKARYSVGCGRLSMRKLQRFIESRRRMGLPVPPGLTPWDR